MKGGNGTFFCPRCQGSRQYTHRKVRRFFTLYFIPVIPLDLVGEFVECNYCQGSYQMQVLDYDPRAQQKRIDSQVRTALNRGLIAVLIADGAPSEGESATALDVIHKISLDTNMTRADLDAAVDSSMKRSSNPANDLAAVAEEISYPQRESYLRAALSVALADGELSTEEDRVIRALARAVGITDAHLTGILATAPRMFNANPPALPS
jgi:tellurite resistance protein